MRNISMATLIGKSLNRTGLILFKTFSLKKWLLLLLIAYLAGAISCGGGNGGGGGTPPVKKREAQQKLLTHSNNDMAGWQDFKFDSISDSKAENLLYLSPAEGVSASTSDSSLEIVLMVVFIAIIAAIAIAAFIFFMWLGARFKFVWLDAIINNDASIAGPFSRYKAEGNSLFKFFLVLTVIGIGFLGLIALWVFSAGAAAGIFDTGSDWSWGAALGVFVPPIIVGILVFITMVLLGVCVKDFVVPIMATDNCLFSSGWRKFAAIAKENLGDVVIYFLVILGLGIVTVILSFLAALACLLVIVLAGLIVLGLPYLIFMVLLKVGPLFWIFAVILGIPLLIAAILLLVSVNLPFAVFFRSFSLYFLSSLNCGYYPLPLEED